MTALDWGSVGLYIVLMLAIGGWSYKRVSNTGDFFAAGGRMPWWISGVSHHVSGYSAVVFTGFAAVAYTDGITIYVWWALTIVVAVVLAAFFVAPRWARLRQRYGVQSPTEYLRVRFGLPTQQTLAWSGCLLKIFDVGAKYAAMAVILHVLADIPLSAGVLIAGVASLIYVTIGGLWADALTDVAQFVVQVLVAVVLLMVTVDELGGVREAAAIWDRLPDHHSTPFSDEYTATFVVLYVLIVFLSYGGGQYNLAQRFIAAPAGSQARKAAFLSAGLYLVFPLLFFYPIWASPLLFGNVEDPEQIYGVLAQGLLPPGLLGLVLAAMFAATMSMTASDSNVVSAIVTRDILPVVSPRFRDLPSRQALRLARLSTLLFTALSLVIALENQRFGGIVDLIVTWFGGLLGPIAIPMILGLLPLFRNSNATAALGSLFAGLVTFAIAYFVDGGQVATTCLPGIVSAVVFIGLGLLNRRGPTADVIEMLDAVSARDTEQPSLDEW